MTTCELQGGKTTFAIAASEAAVTIVVITEIIETTLSVSVIDEINDVMTMFLDEENYEMTMDDLMER
jgi:hypothetical protein